MFKVGDMVKVKKDLTIIKSEYPGISEKMLNYEGTIQKIISIGRLSGCGLPYYTLENIMFLWTDEMLEPVKQPKGVWAKDHNCFTCAYSGKKIHEYPCYQCIRNNGAEERWVSRSEVKKKSHDDDMMDAFMYGLHRAIPVTGSVGFPSISKQKNSEFYFGGTIYNVVFVTHDEDIHDPKKLYLFRTYRTHLKGDKLFADTKNGKKLVTAATGSFLINKDGLDAMDIMHGCHKGKLKAITGYAQKQEEWKEVPFK